MVLSSSHEDIAPLEFFHALLFTEELDGFPVSFRTLFSFNEGFAILGIQNVSFEPTEAFFEVRYEKFWVYSNLVLLLKNLLRKFCPILLSH